MKLQDLFEAKNHLGDTEYTTYKSWKAAIKKAANGKPIKFTGDVDKKNLVESSAEGWFVVAPGGRALAGPFKTKAAGEQKARDGAVEDGIKVTVKYGREKGWDFEVLPEPKTEGLSQLSEMAKRSKPDDFYAMAKKKYGADKVKALKWSEVKAVADENDVLIPPYLRTQKVGRGLFNLVPPDHADSKPAPKEEPKKAPSADAVKASVARMVDGAIKDSAPKADAPKEYKYPQTDNVSYSDWSEFYGGLKKRFGSFELERVPYGAQRQSRYGGQLGVKLLVDKKTDRVIGVWEVTDIDKVPGRGMVSYGRGTMAKEKQEAPKAAEKPAEKPAEKRAGGKASDDEMKTALLDVAAEMKSHKGGRGADWRMTPEKVGKRWEIDVRYWGHWEGDDGSGDYDFQDLSSKSSKEIASILNQVEKRHKNVALSFQTSEKNWLSISAS